MTWAIHKLSAWNDFLINTCSMQVTSSPSTSCNVHFKCPLLNFFYANCGDNWHLSFMHVMPTLHGDHLYLHFCVIERPDAQCFESTKYIFWCPCSSQRDWNPIGQVLFTNSTPFVWMWPNVPTMLATILPNLGWLCHPWMVNLLLEWFLPPWTNFNKTSGWLSEAILTKKYNQSTPLPPWVSRYLCYLTCTIWFGWRGETILY